MTHRDDDERSTEQSSETAAQSSEAPSETSGADATPEPEPEPDERDPEVAEIEDDPSRNPDNELLRDIKGG